MILPSVLNYSESLPSLPVDSKKTQVVINPSNQQSSYGPSNMIMFDLLQQGYLVPDSLQIRYKMSVSTTTNANGSGYFLCGTPVYSPFQREEIIVNSQVIESINGYNQVHNIMTNLKYSVAQKYGVAPSYGFSQSESIGKSPELENIDGRFFSGAASTALVDTFSMAAPLPCLLSYSHNNKLIPLAYMGGTRIQLTLDSISNIFSVGSDLVSTSAAAVPLPSGFSITNIELVYDMLEFNADVNEVVRKNEKIFLKSQSFSNTQQTLSPCSGSVTMTFNTRLSSIKSAFLNMSSTSASKSVNRLFDSVDITKGNGDFQLSVGGLNYPQRALSTLTSKGSIFQSLRDAVGTIHDSQNSLSISRNEWNMTDDSTSLIYVPGKFIVGFNLEKLHSSSLLTGISSTQTAVNLIMNLGTAMTTAANVNLVLNFDALIEIDLVNRQCTIKQ